jgi:ubiquitin conjugation factor E4 B
MPNTSTSQQADSQNPSDKLKVQSAKPSPASLIRITPARASEKRPREASDGLSASPARKVAPLVKDESVDAFESRILANIFRITVDEQNKTVVSGQKLIYLPNLKQELEDSGEPPRLSVGSLDSALMEACGKLPRNKPILDYLLPCWKRITKSLKSLRGQAPAKDALLKEARRLCMSHCIFAITVPELYGREEGSFKDSLVSYLLAAPEDDKGICPDFLTEAVSRWDEDDTVKPMFTKTVAQLSSQLSRMTMNDDYEPYVRALKNLTRFSQITTAIAEDPLFQMATSAPGIEQHTLLGPFFRISPLQADVTKTYFAAPNTMDKGHVLTSQSALRMSLNTHQKDLLDIINQFVRASATSRNRTLDWFAYIVNANHKRRAIQVDEKQVSSDGFLMNVTVILDGLCEPFMDSTFSKISKIDPEYFRRNPRIDIKDETKLNSDQKTSDKFYETKLEGVPNFITEVFFLTLAAHHYGSECTNAKLKSLDKDIKYFRWKMASMELERRKLSTVSFSFPTLD